MDLSKFNICSVAKEKIRQRFFDKRSIKRKSLEESDVADTSSKSDKSSQSGEEKDRPKIKRERTVVPKPGPSDNVLCVEKDDGFPLITSVYSLAAGFGSEAGLVNIGAELAPSVKTGSTETQPSVLPVAGTFNASTVPFVVQSTNGVITVCSPPRTSVAAINNYVATMQNEPTQATHDPSYSASSYIQGGNVLPTATDAFSTSTSGISGASKISAEKDSIQVQGMPLRVQAQQSTVATNTALPQPAVTQRTLPASTNQNSEKRPSNYLQPRDSLPKAENQSEEESGDPDRSTFKDQCSSLDSISNITTSAEHQTSSPEEISNEASTSDTTDQSTKEEKGERLVTKQDDRIRRLKDLLRQQEEELEKLRFKGKATTVDSSSSEATSTIDRRINKLLKGNNNLCSHGHRSFVGNELKSKNLQSPPQGDKNYAANDDQGNSEKDLKSSVDTKMSSSPLKRKSSSPDSGSSKPTEETKGLGPPLKKMVNVTVLKGHTRTLAVPVDKPNQPGNERKTRSISKLKRTRNSLRASRTSKQAAGSRAYSVAAKFRDAKGKPNESKRKRSARKGAKTGAYQGRKKSSSSGVLANKNSSKTGNEKANITSDRASNTTNATATTTTAIRTSTGDKEPPTKATISAPKNLPNLVVGNIHNTPINQASTVVQSGILPNDPTKLNLKTSTISMANAPNKNLTSNPNIPANNRYILLTKGDALSRGVSVNKTPKRGPDPEKLRKALENIQKHVFSLTRKPINQKIGQVNGNASSDQPGVSVSSSGPGHRPVAGTVSSSQPTIGASSAVSRAAPVDVTASSSQPTGSLSNLIQDLRAIAGTISKNQPTTIASTIAQRNMQSCATVANTQPNLSSCLPRLIPAGFTASNSYPATNVTSVVPSTTQVGLSVLKSQPNASVSGLLQGLRAITATASNSQPTGNISVSSPVQRLIPVGVTVTSRQPATSVLPSTTQVGLTITNSQPSKAGGSVSTRPMHSLAPKPSPKPNEKVFIYSIAKPTVNTGLKLPLPKQNVGDGNVVVCNVIPPKITPKPGQVFLSPVNTNKGQVIVYVPNPTPGQKVGVVNNQNVVITTEKPNSTTSPVQPKSSEFIPNPGDSDFTKLLGLEHVVSSLNSNQ